MYIWKIISRIIAEVLRIWPKYLLFNLIRGLGLTVTKWFSPWMGQWSITPMFKRDNIYFKWFSPESIRHGIWKQHKFTVKTSNHTGTETLQKLLTTDKVKDTSATEKIWIIHFHRYTTSATFTMNYRAHHGQDFPQESPEAGSLTLPTCAPLLLQTERKTDGGWKCCW